jgi:hypothetical protein
MTPQLHAARDSFIYDVAMCVYVAETLPPEALGSVCEATGWTAAQTMEHLTANYERYADLFERRLSGQAVAISGGQSEQETVEPEAIDGPSEHIARLLAARRRILVSLERFTPGQESSPIAEGRKPLVEAATIWAAHASGHALDFIEAHPPFAADALVMGWAFSPQISEDDALRERRAALFKRLKDARR